MDPVRNPFAPGAGNPPPELAGRQEILTHATTILLRTLQQRHAKSFMLVGLRGVGKTVLLNRIGQIAGQKVVSTTTYTTICYLVCALTCLVFVIPSGASLVDYPRFEWLLILGLIVGAQLLGHSMFNQVLVRVNPAVVSLIVFFEVPVGALLAVWWLDQVPPAGIIPGIALLIFGSALVATRTSQLQGAQANAH